jgi:hypothetical protein
MEAINFELLIRLLVAHLLSDFIFQKKNWADDKDKHGFKSRFLYLHIAITAVVLSIVIWDLSLYPVILWITGVHFVIDATKSRIPITGIWVFLTDQFLHLLVILLVWLAYTHQFQVFYNEVLAIMLLPKVWLLLFLYILLTMPTAVLIGKMTQKWSDEIEKEGKDKKTGLKDAGKWIGIIERVLIFTFVVINELSVIGFLLAAKSIFRFGDLKESSEHKKTEYIIIGTLLSFVLAIGVGLLYKLVIK